ncbi:alpha/beta hydrolase [Rhodocytophaga rosea]|uniref:Alpha/beta hydrolase n=1 Tax=Rhodocytophaga rosea TaxID=2704465 RepID=A0A6C0GW46_9BACT|nr:alpha/beta hydrolase [Rhodocytophaga rosea]QHT71562.1 alpha/beta hydrolase [Rhodocytophaga rosea]
MKRNIFRILKYTVFIGIIIVLLQVFLPRSYNVPPLFPRPTTQFWNLPTGSTIAYTLISGQGKKKPYPVIYLHGGPGGYIRQSFIKDISALANEGYDLYLYDQIGSGLSKRLDTITHYTVNRHIRDLAAIIEKLGKGKVILIGQSWGAILATLFAEKYPHKINKLILTSPGPIYPVNRKLANLPAPDSLHFIKPYFTNAQGNKKANNIRTRTMAFAATRFGIKLASDQEADAFATYLNYEVNRSVVCDTAKILDMDAGSGFFAGIMTFYDLLTVPDPRPGLKKLNMPVLIMKGECDNQPWAIQVNIYRCLATIVWWSYRMQAILFLLNNPYFI